MKWEYKLIRAEVGLLKSNVNKVTKELNELGEEGWELTTTALGQNFILKRELK